MLFLEQFDGNEDKLMTLGQKNRQLRETELYKQHTEKFL